MHPQDVLAKTVEVGGEKACKRQLAAVGLGEAAPDFEPIIAEVDKA
jgi:hypothetical protein